MTRTPRPVLALLALLLLAASCSSDGGSEEAAAPEDSIFAGRPALENTPKPEFTLTDTEGQPFEFAAETEGSVTFLFFGYTSCPDICPVHLAQLGELLNEPGAPSNVDVVFVSIDPERDTPDVIRDFLDEFDSDFVGLTGTADELEAAQLAAGVTPAVKEPNEEDPDEYTMGHWAAVLAYAPNGLLYTQYPFGTRQSEFAHDIPILAELRTLDDEPAA